MYSPNRVEKIKTGEAFADRDKIQLLENLSFLMVIKKMN